MTKNTLYNKEEQIVSNAETILQSKNYTKAPLNVEYSTLLKEYKKTFKQLKRLIKISDKQQLRLNQLNGTLDVHNQFIRQTFGRYLSDEIVSNILETPEGLNLGGEKRDVTIMMTDLRGFTAIGERLPAEQVVDIINIYLETMIDIIFKYEGTIDEFIGDAILVIFGAPIMRDDDAKRAVACAVEMQLAMKEVNARCVEKKYPKIFQGIGINTGSVVVGNIGSKKRSKYGVVGKNVNLTSRIESYTVGGQIFVSEKTVEACDSLLRVDSFMEVEPKGVKRPITIYDIGGINAPFNIFLPEKKQIELDLLHKAISVKFDVIDGKHIDSESINKGRITKLSLDTALLEMDISLNPLTNIKLSLFDSENNQFFEDIYAKVVKNVDNLQNFVIINFTSVPPDADNFIKNNLKHNLREN